MENQYACREYSFLYCTTIHPTLYALTKLNSHKGKNLHKVVFAFYTSILLIFFYGNVFEAYSLFSTSKDHMKYETFKCNFLKILEHFVIYNFLIWTWLPQITLYPKSLNMSYPARLKNYIHQKCSSLLWNIQCIPKTYSSFHIWYDIEMD